MDPTRHPLVILACCATLACLASAQLSIRHTDAATRPDTTTDQHGQPFTITGVSGVTRIGGDAYAAVMDNSDKVVLFDLAIAADGAITALSNVRGLTLAGTGDHEGIAAAGPGSFLVSDESSMTIAEYSIADGSLLAAAGVPEVYAARRSNLGLESLSPDAPLVWTANEEALPPDGPRASPETGTVVRILRAGADTILPLAQHAYIVDPMHGPRIPVGNPGQSGLCDLVALPDGSLLALERSLALASPLFLTRIYEVHLGPADDVAALPALRDADYTPAAKTLRYQGGHDNLEGLCLGPRLSATEHALVGVVDDGDPVSTNAVVVFALAGLQACPADLDGDGRATIDDLYMLHQTPADLNGDGAADAEDLRCFQRFLRRHEAFDMRSGTGR